MIFPSRISRPTQFTLTFIVLLAIGLAGWSGCRSTPVTGRRQVLLVPEQQEISMGVEAYNDILSKETPSTNRRYIEMVNRVGRRIAAVADRPDYDWEFRVIASDKQNAFALPGGKVAVYEGIIPVCQSEAGLAVVMSHEVAHALARHGGERMTGGMVQTAGQKVTDFITRNQTEGNQKLVQTVYGVGTEYGAMRPFSRKQESEADHIGLMLMARAGYQPEEAPKFWQRFAAAGSGDKPPWFLSTHPTDERRAADLKALLPEAMEIYSQVPTRHGIGEYLTAP